MKNLLKIAEDSKEYEKKRKAEAAENSSLIKTLSKKVEAAEQELLKEKVNTERMIAKMTVNADPIVPDTTTATTTATTNADFTATTTDVSKKHVSNTERMQQQLHSDMKVITAQQFLNYCDFVDLQRDAKERMKVLYNSDH